ncbi:MAG: hypothetical protein JKY94_17745 [Rhodobacteraceae bacterium]|nr:hypothetical protein [Paracoccaceae bacterium]
MSLIRARNARLFSVLVSAILKAFLLDEGVKSRVVDRFSVRLDAGHPVKLGDVYRVHGGGHAAVVAFGTGGVYG